MQGRPGGPTGEEDFGEGVQQPVYEDLVDFRK